MTVTVIKEASPQSRRYNNVFKNFYKNLHTPDHNPNINKIYKFLNTITPPQLTQDLYPQRKSTL